MSKNSNSSSSGIGVLGLLGVTFVILKLCKVITWSWWWVTLPFWGGLALVLIILLVILIFKMLTNSKSQAGTNAQQRTNDEVITSSHTIGKPNVACCVSSTYKQVEAEKEITMSNSKSTMSPVATLKNEYGGVCQIINDDNCYVVCLKQQDGTYKPTTHIFKEAFEVLSKLGCPN